MFEKNKNSIQQLRLIRIIYIKSINDYILKKSRNEVSSKLDELPSHVIINAPEPKFIAHSL